MPRFKSEKFSNLDSSPRKPLTAAEDKPALVPPPSRSLDEIIRARMAGLPPEQEIDVYRRTIIDVLMTQPDVQLTGMARHDVALALERLWIPKRELAKIERQRVLRSTERALEIVKRAKKLARKHGLPTRGSAIAAIRPALVKGPDGRRFQSPAALKQFLKRERRAKKRR
jgi:hypothetical protein